MCDYQYVNSFAVAYPMQNVEDVLNKIGHSNLTTTWDARGTYWQSPVSPSDRWLTAIVTPSGLWERMRTPFGMRNSGSNVLLFVLFRLYYARFMIPHHRMLMTWLLVVRIGQSI